MQNYVHKGKPSPSRRPTPTLPAWACLLGTSSAWRSTTRLRRVAGDRTWGVFDLAKDGSTFNSGDKVYWDNVNPWPRRSTRDRRPRLQGRRSALRC